VSLTLYLQTISSMRRRNTSQSVMISTRPSLNLLATKKITLLSESSLYSTSINQLPLSKISVSQSNYQSISHSINNYAAADYLIMLLIHLRLDDMPIIIIKNMLCKISQQKYCFVEANFNQFMILFPFFSCLSFLTSQCYLSTSLSV